MKNKILENEINNIDNNILNKNIIRINLLACYYNDNAMIVKKEDFNTLYWLREFRVIANKIQNEINCVCQLNKDERTEIGIICKFPSNFWNNKFKDSPVLITKNHFFNFKGNNIIEINSIIENNPNYQKNIKININDDNRIIYDIDEFNISIIELKKNEILINDDKYLKSLSDFMFYFNENNLFSEMYNRLYMLISLSLGIKNDIFLVLRANGQTRLRFINTKEKDIISTQISSFGNFIFVKAKLDISYVFSEQDQMYLYYINLSNLDFSEESYIIIKVNFRKSIVDCSNMFRDIKDLVHVDLHNLDTDKVNNMSNMFRNCSNLGEIIFKNHCRNYGNYFTTQNITDMSYMFYGCLNLNYLDLISFNTQKVTNMSFMFSSCPNLSKIDLSSFYTENVINMSNMFYFCEKLNKISFTDSFITKNVRDMSYMFCGCTGLNEINLSFFDTTRVKTMKSMFMNCRNLKFIDLQSFNTENVRNMNSMFKYCYHLNGANLTSFNTNSLKNIDYMFEYCRNLKEIDLRSFNFNNVDDIHLMFDNIKKAINIKINNFFKNKLNTINALKSGILFPQ